MTTRWSDAAFAAATPRPRISVSAWADRYRVVAAGTSPEPQQWRTSRTPYLRAIMDAVSDPAVERVVVMAASQIGKTEILLNLIGYYAHQDPSPILLVQATEIASTAFAKERIEPTFRASPALAGLLSDGLRDKGNTVLLKMFPGGYLACAWATSSVSLASRPIRVVLLDEIDRYPDSIGRDGDPVAQAVQRTSNFYNRKIVSVSTPTIEGLSAIERQYEDTDQSRLWVPCPRCGVFQVLEWAGVIYKGTDGEVNLDDVHYRCAHCGDRIEERDRPAMLAAGQWQADNPGHPHRGFQLSALYSPWVRWRDLARQWLKADRDRDKRGLQEFINLRLGEAWFEGGDRVSADALEKNREEYGIDVPDGVLLLTCGVDVQDNRLEAEIVGWGTAKQSWGIHYAILIGDTSGPDVWAALDQLLGRTWARADGAHLALWRTCVDSGGHRADEVYEYSRIHGARVAAIKGRGGPGIAIVTGKPSIVGQKRSLLFFVGADAAKDAVFSRLIHPAPGPGYCHFPVDPMHGYDTEYFRGLCSERRKRKMRAGRQVSEWTQEYTRNEPLDCRCYATAALELALIVDGIDLDKLAAEANRPRPPTSPAPAAALVPRRRVYSKGVAW